MGVNIWINHNKVYLDIYVKGQRRRERLSGLELVGDKAVDRETMRLANIAKARRAQQVFAEEWDLLDPVAGKQSLFSYGEKLSKKPGANRHIRILLQHLERFTGGKTIQIGQVTGAWVEKFQEWLAAQGIIMSTVKAYCQALRIILNRAVKENILTKSPAGAVPLPPAPEADIVFLNIDEVRMLAAAEANGSMEALAKKAFLFGCLTGLRISDIESLAWGEIEHSPLQIVKRMKKTGDVVYVPLKDAAWKIINDGRLHHYKERVFPGLIKKRSVQLDRWARRAGLVKHIGWHTARHTFAVLSLEAGADLYTVSKLLGHRSIKTTQRYAKVTDKLKRAAVEALPDIEAEGFM